MKELNSMNISGNGEIPEGKYNKIRISGSGIINGNIECNSIAVSGSGKFLGNVNSSEIRISGSCDYKKNIKGNSLRVSGSLNCYDSVYLDKELKISGVGKVYGSLYGKYIIINGNIDIDKGVSFNTMNTSGIVNIKGNCEGNDFKSSGKINIDGLLSADKIEILVHRKVFIKEIGGEEIIIRNYGSKMIWPISITFSGKRKVKSELIEGDRIRLSSTECSLVRGDDIIIEEGCKIDCIEYTRSLEINDNSKVLNIIKIENSKNLI